MKPLIVLLALLFATPSYAIMLVGFGGNACTTQSADVSLTVNNASSGFSITNERGQSWKSGVTGSLYSFTLRKNSTESSSVTLTYRIGTSSDLSSSYLVESTCTSIPYGAAGTFSCVIPSGSRPSLTSGTTYYVLFNVNHSFDLARDSLGGYADGTSYYDDAAQDWIGTAAVSDLYFSTKMCD